MKESFLKTFILEPESVFYQVSSQEELVENETEFTCNRYATDIWSGIRNMSQTHTGYPEDMIRVKDGIKIPNHKTSPTNIGLFLASSIAALDMHLATSYEVEQSVNRVLNSLEEADTHDGLFYNWYDTQTGKLSEDCEKPLISTVDNAWLATGLMIVQASDMEGSQRATNLINQMNFPLLYDDNRNLFFGMYDPEISKPSEWHYDILNTEARIASYIGISTFNIPSINYSRLGKYSPADIEFSSQNSRSHFSSWGGSMFEALLPTLFVPESEWSEAWEDSHRQYIQKQMQHGENHTNGFWGYSPCFTPEGRYQEAGLSEIAMKEGGYGNSDIVTPHALYLSLEFMPTQVIENLQRLESVYPDLYKEGLGFSDSVHIHTGEVAPTYLSLDQEMSFISLFNFLSENKMHQYLAPQLEVIKPLVASLDSQQLLIA